MTAPEQDGPVSLSSPQVAQVAGISYKQADHWARQGYLHPEHQGGSGHGRAWSPEEAEIARRMALLVAAGIMPAVAVTFARQCWPTGEIGPAITVTVDEP